MPTSNQTGPCPTWAKWLTALLFRMGSKAALWSTMSFSLSLFLACPDARVYGNTRKRGHLLETRLRKRTGSPSLSCQGLTSLVLLGNSCRPGGRNLLWWCLFSSPPWIPKGSPGLWPVPVGQSCSHERFSSSWCTPASPPRSRALPLNLWGGWLGEVSLGSMAGFPLEDLEGPLGLHGSTGGWNLTLPWCHRCA